MTLPAVNVNSIATHTDLTNEVHGVGNLMPILPRDANGDSHAVRTLAYQDVIKALRRRVPPIYEADLQDRTELRDAVVYGTLARLYLAAITTGAVDDKFATKWRHYRDLFDAEIAGLSPTVQSGSVASSSTIEFGRR